MGIKNKKSAFKNIFTIILKVRDINVFWKMGQLLLLIKPMALISGKKKLLGRICLTH